MSEDKKNIVVCYPCVPFMYGGGEIHKNELVKQLRLKGHNVEEVLLPFKWYPKIQILKDCAAWRMLDLTEANGKKIDMVITTKFPAYIVHHPNKVIWMIHQLREAYDLEGTEYDEFKTQEDLYIKACIRNIDDEAFHEAKKIFTISKNVSGRLSRYNGVESEVLYPPVSNRELFKAGDYGDYILYTGRIDPKKRIEIMIETMRYIKNNIKFMITGRCDNEYAQRLMEMVKKNNLQNRVKFLGFVGQDELIDLYANCFSVFYAPLDEDYGYSTIEAFLSKKPVLTAKDSGGPLEFVTDTQNGIIFDESDLKSLAQRISALFADKDMAKRMGESGYKVVKDISWDNVINQLIECIK